jgi:DNA-binding MarR family transcriptional regulator
MEVVVGRTNTNGGLETKQLVKRHSHPHDRRATLVTISEQGRALADDATRSLSRLDFGLPDLAPSQARALSATIARVRAGAGNLDRSYCPAPNEHA